MCQLWDECVTYEYSIEGGGKPDNGAYSGGGMRMRCELWVYPFDANGYTVSDNVANEGKVWCGAAGGDYNNDGTQDPQTMEALDAKGTHRWPPDDNNLIIAVDLLDASAYRYGNPPGYVEAEIWGYLDGADTGLHGAVGDREKLGILAEGREQDGVGAGAPGLRPQRTDLIIKRGAAGRGSGCAGRPSGRRQGQIPNRCWRWCSPAVPAARPQAALHSSTFIMPMRNTVMASNAVAIIAPTSGSKLSRTGSATVPVCAAEKAMGTGRNSVKST